MPATEKKPAKIACACGACELTLADGNATMHILCGCEDCRQALQWGYKNGGVKPDPLQRAFYMRSDIADVKGREKMLTVKLREDGVSRRVYCTNCYSVLGVDHPAYMSSVFLNFPRHCVNGGELSAPLSLMLFMQDYSEDIGPLPDDKVPVFQSLRFPQKIDRIMSIEAAANTWFKEPAAPAEGITFTALIESLGSPLVLNLEKGAKLL
ncbi:MAG: hypothetical protein EXR07_02835 [Acetobacteraceae bacterium]|nr:hypothetical protein [Acetobacteraceae bacterium]